MKTTNPQYMKVLWLVHIIAMIAWVGGIAANLLLQAVTITLGETALFGVYSSIHTIDVYIIRNGALGLLGTGFLYGVTTNWGFFKYRWVAVKWVLFILQMGFGIFYIGELTETNYKMVTASTAGLLNNPMFIHNLNAILKSQTLQLLGLILVIILSKYKPWGKR